MPNNVLNDYLNALQSTEPEEEEKRKESPHFIAAYSAYQNSITPEVDRPTRDIGTQNYLDKYSQSLNAPLQPSTRRGAYTLDDLEKDPEFQLRAERFMEEIGKDEEIFEYLRDPEFSIYSAMNLASEVGEWSDQAKQDYTYLKDTFQNADLGSTRQFMKLMGNATVDLLADPFNWLAVAFFPLTGGMSGAAAVAAKQTAKQGLKKYVKSKATKEVLEAAKRPAILGAAEGAAWVGSHDYFLQNVDVELGLRESLDKSQVAISTALGTTLGGFFGGTIGGLTVLAPALYRKLNKFSNEGELITTKVDRKAEAEAYDLLSANNAVKEPPKKLEKGKRAISLTFGKPVAQFLGFADNSAKMQELLGKFRYDWARTFTKGAQAVEADSYGLDLSNVLHTNLYEMRKALNNLYRGSDVWRNTLRQDQNDALAYLLRDKKLLDRAISTGNVKYEGQLIDRVVIDAAKDVRLLLDNIFKQAADQGLLASGRFNSQHIKGYFPRFFKYQAVVDNRKDLENLIYKSGHADIKNSYSQKDYIEIFAKDIDTDKILHATETEIVGNKVKGLRADADLIDKESFGRNFLKDAEGNMEKAKRLKSEAIVQDIIDRKTSPFQYSSKNNAGGGHSFLQHRVFDKISDQDLAPFLEGDVEDVLTNYITDAARATTRTKFFGRTVQDFERDWLDPIRRELGDSGVEVDEINEAIRRLRIMHERITGLDTDKIAFKGGLRWGTDFLKLSQQMAHLPFATISSLTEPMILLTRIDTGKLPAAKEVGKALVKGVKKDIDKFTDFVRRTSGKDVKGFKDIGDEYWEEAYKSGLAMEQAVQSLIEGLYGEAAHSPRLRKVQNAFFKTNFLTQWTGAVQVASFTTGKRLIRENIQKLHDDVQGTAKLSNSKREYLTKQLWELGIDEKEGMKWYKNSLTPDGTFDEGVAKGAAFYMNSYLRGAGRFTKEIILNPSTAEANRPLWFSHPAGQIFSQFAGYPTVFNNTILKRWINEGAFEHKLQTSPKIIGTALAMTAVATFTNAMRSQGRSLEREDGRVITEAVQRWGGLGPFDYVERFIRNKEYGSGQVGAMVKTPFGPVAQDVVDAILYRKGFTEIGATNLPFYSAYPYEWREAIRKFARGSKDKKPKKVTQAFYAKGGEVHNVPNVPVEPDERIDRMTGRPYTEQGGILAQDEEERLGFIFGGVASRLARFAPTKSLKKLLLGLDREPELDELTQHLTQDVRRDTPVLQSEDTVSIYTPKEAKKFADDSAYFDEDDVLRYSYSNKISDLEEELRYSTMVGAHVGDESMLVGKTFREGVESYVDKEKGFIPEISDIIRRDQQEISSRIAGQPGTEELLTRVGNRIEADFIEGIAQHLDPLLERAELQHYQHSLMRDYNFKNYKSTVSKVGLKISKELSEKDKKQILRLNKRINHIRGDIREMNELKGKSRFPLNKERLDDMLSRQKSDLDYAVRERTSIIRPYLRAETVDLTGDITRAPKTNVHTGKVRLVNPLNLGPIKEGELLGAEFVRSLNPNVTRRNNIIENSLLPNKTASRIVSDLLDEYDETEFLIRQGKATEANQHLFNIQQSIKARNALKELGYDGIRYTTAGSTRPNYVLFNNNQFRTTKTGKYLEEKGEMTRYKPITEKEARLGRGTESFDEWYERNLEELEIMAREEGYYEGDLTDLDIYAEAKWDEGWGRFTEWTQGAPLGLYSKSFEALQNLPKNSKIFIKNKEGIPVLTVERMEKQLGKAGLKKAEIEGVKDYLAADTLPKKAEKIQNEIKILDEMYQLSDEYNYAPREERRLGEVLEREYRALVPAFKEIIRTTKGAEDLPSVYESIETITFGDRLGTGAKQFEKLRLLKVKENIQVLDQIKTAPKPEFTKEQIVAASQGVFNKLKDIKVQHINRANALREQGAGEEAILGGVSADIADYDVVRIYLNDAELWKQSRGVSEMPMTHFGAKTIGWTRATKRKKGDTEKEGYVKFIDELQRDGTDRLIKEPFKSNDYRMALLARLRHEANDPSIDEVALNHMDLVNTMGGIHVPQASLTQWYHPTKGQFVADMRDVAKEFGGKVQYKTYPFLPTKDAPAFVYKNTGPVEEYMIPGLDDAITEWERKLAGLMARQNKLQETAPRGSTPNKLEEAIKDSEDGRRTLQRLQKVRKELKISRNDLDARIKQQAGFLEGTTRSERATRRRDRDLADTIVPYVERDKRELEILVNAKKEFGDDYHLLNLTREEVRFLSDLINFGETPSGLWQPLSPPTTQKNIDDIMDWFDFLESTGAEAYEVPYITLTDELRRNLLTKPARLFKKEGGLVGQMDRLGFAEGTSSAEEDNVLDKFLATIKRSLDKGKEFTQTTKDILSSTDFRLYSDAVIKRKKETITEDWFTKEELESIQDDVASLFGPDRYRSSFATRSKNIDPSANTISIPHKWLYQSEGTLPVYQVLGTSIIKIAHKKPYNSANIEVYDEYDFNYRQGGRDNFLKQGINLLKSMFTGDYRAVERRAMRLAEKYGAYVLPDEETAKKENRKANYVPIKINIPVSDIMDEDTWKSYQSKITYND